MSGRDEGRPFGPAPCGSLLVYSKRRRVSFVTNAPASTGRNASVSHAVAVIEDRDGADRSPTRAEGDERQCDGSDQEQHRSFLSSIPRRNAEVPCLALRGYRRRDPCEAGAA